jgi:hypothetical protein
MRQIDDLFVTTDLQFGVELNIGPASAGSVGPVPPALPFSAHTKVWRGVGT